MDLRFTDEEIAFRNEVRNFIRASLPETIRRKLIDGRELSKEEIVTWQRILNRRGWAVPHWPKEWGGSGWTPIQHYIFSEEIQQAPAPRPIAYNVFMVGPVIIAYGSEEQKRRFLPRIANADDWWCQGFSEPEAGSDLAALKTSARRDGDVYIVNGQKTWTTYAHYADWMFCLVRTDPHAKKQAGISFLLIDMKSKGIDVRPITTIDGGHEVNEVFLDNVRVPVENLVGEENKGWDYAKFLLGAERTNIARVGVSKERIRRIKELAARVQDDNCRLIDDERFCERLAAIEVELKSLEITQMRIVAAEQHAGRGKPDPASSILKIKGSELQQATTELLLQVAGPYALPYLDQQAQPESLASGMEWAATAAPTYFNWRKISIYGGSNEIQKNIIARAILGL
ncbi:MAG TPA: pimeloyl-CoA dehydrogenase large subunit [Xanthobacteraceae bacterium]|nr:pimeloyl-CoA dehydrogenase large subunit [Xanthobacteraceae bacterium]